MTLPVTFNVEFNFTGVPAAVLSVVTTIPDVDKVNLQGYYVITQPDGMTVTGTSAISWDGLVFSTYTAPLRLGSDLRYQKGTYTITLHATCTGYDDLVFTRTWDMEYKPVTQIFTDGFDCFTPSLKYTDSTNYQVSGYSITAQTSAWSATSLSGNPTGTSSIFDLAIGGNYYDSTYAISYVKTVNYLNTTYAWLTVKDKLTYSVTNKAIIPSNLDVLLGYVTKIKTARDAAKTNCQTYDDLDAIFQEANSLFLHIKSRVCSGDTIGLIPSFEELYKITHNNRGIVYVNTNTVIPPYDFSTACGGSGGTGGPTLHYQIRPTPGATSFTITSLLTKTISGVVRSGFTKGLTTSPTTDVDYVQRVNNVITLPTGDSVGSVTLPDGSVVGELFIIEYS